MHEIDFRRVLGVTLLSSVLVTLSGCGGGESETAADAGGPGGAEVAAVTSGAQGTPPALTEEQRERFEQASQVALDRAARTEADRPAAKAAAAPPTTGFNMTGGSASDAVIAAPTATVSQAGAGLAPSLSATADGTRPGTGSAAVRPRPAAGSQPEVLTEEARRAKTAAAEARRIARETGEPANEREAVARALDGGGGGSAAAVGAPAPVASAASSGESALPGGVTLEPEVLEFGDIPLGSSKTATVRIVNSSDRPYKLIDCRATCGCTTTQCPKGETIAANGGSVEVEIQLDGGETAQKLRKTVSFLISDGHPPLRLALDATAVAFVSISPERLDRGQHPDGAVTITAADGTPFRIVSMFPPVLTPEELPQEAAAEQVVNIPWDKLYESGSTQSRILFRLDHPKADRVLMPLSVNVLRDMRERRGNVAAGGPAAGTPSRAPGRDLNTLLSRNEIDTVLQMIADDQVDINKPDAARHTPMIKAARYGAVEVIMALADKGADLEAQDGMGRTPISYAAQSRSLDSVITLLDLGANVNHVDQTGNTPLGWAAGFGTVGMCEVMIEAGADVNAGAGTLLGFTPLIWASMAGAEADKVKLLIEKGADLEARDTMEQATVVMHAIRTNMMANVEVLLAAGAKLDVTDAKGRTALHVAAANGAPDRRMIEFLLGRGLDPKATTRAGETPLDLARKRKDSKAGEVIAALEAAMGG